MFTKVIVPTWRCNNVSYIVIYLDDKKPQQTLSTSDTQDIDEDLPFIDVQEMLTEKIVEENSDAMDS